ncbi:MAG: DinB family protein [Bacteroidetes bacterium]|nr:MAG: DinB family protein [Bacteroidota bacterium]
MENPLAFFEDLQTRTQNLSQTIQTECRDMPLHILNAKPEPTAWSVLECLEHLNLYANYYHRAIEDALHKLPKKASPTAHKISWVGRQGVSAVSPQNTRKQKAYSRMKPVTSTLDRYVLEHFAQHQQDLVRLLQDAQYKDINKKAIPLEFFKWIKLNIGDTFLFLVVHMERHLQQVLRTKKAVMPIS